ncbi:MAG: beta-ketoacyl-ACP synthase III [Salinispira sp.]
MKAYIRSVGVYLPARIVTNDELSQTLNTNDDWIFSHTGIHERRIAAENEAASDLAYKAAVAALESLHTQDDSISAADIDLILLATSTPDYPGLPSTACIVQERLAAKNAGAMDIVAACTGFIYALETARAFVASGGARNVLVIGAEVYSKIVNWQDRSTCVLFGDGAGAVLVSAAEENSESAVIGSFLRSDGSGVEHLFCPGGGSRQPHHQEKNETDQYLYMNGRQVYIFAVKAIIETVKQLEKQYDLSIDDVDHVIPHQANRRIIEAACKREGWPEEKFFMNMDRYANTSAASIPIALEEMEKKNILTRGDRILMVGFGAGLTFGGNYLMW